MPPARSSSARSAAAPQRAVPRRSPSAPQPGFSPRRVKSRAPLSRIRWDRATRVGLVVVILLLGYLWISGLTSLCAHHTQAAQGLSQVRQLTAQNRALLAEERALHQRSTIVADARKLGMVHTGEQAFVLTH
jgi:cell division protein FtsB